MFLLGDLVSVGLLLRFGVASALWVLFQLLIRFHPRGIEIVGAILVALGFIWWLLIPIQNPPFAPLLLLTGLLTHAVGRFLRWLR